MKIIGDKKVFAIGFNILDVDTSNDVIEYYGDICFFLCGKRVGAENKVAYLSTCVSYLKEFISQREHRRFLGSHKLNAENLFFILYERFYNMDFPLSNDFVEAGVFSRIYSLESVGQENFMDEVKLILLDEFPLNRQRFIWKLYKDEILHECFVPLGYFEKVSLDFISNIEIEIELRLS